MVENPSPPQPQGRPAVQYSLQSLMVLTALLGCGLAAWKLSGPRLFQQYFVLLYGCGPWFAYLVGECLPTPIRVVRTAFANALLMALVVVGLSLWRQWFDWHGVVYGTALTALVWTPQYLAFFHRRAAGI